MEVVESTRRQSRSRSLAVQPGAEGLGSTSELLPSDGNPRSALAAATAAATAATTAKTAAFSTKTPECRSEPSFLRPPGEPCTRASFTHKIGWRRPGFEPVCVSRFSQDPCTTNDLSSSPVPVPGSSAGPSHGSGPGCDSGQGTGPDSGPGSDTDIGPSPDCGHDPELSPYSLPSFRNPGEELVPDYTSWNHYSHHWEPQKQPWKFLQLSGPGAQGQQKTPQVEEKCKVLNETLPRGHCLLFNWEEERATNHLDQVPSMQDGSESFFFRHGHQGLLTMQLPSPMSFSTTQKDSYQPPRNYYPPIRGKREAMLEMLLHHQICLMTTDGSSLKPSGYRGHHSYRVSATSRPWTRHSGRTAASRHQYPYRWGSLCPMNLRIIPTNWEKYLPLPVREEDKVVKWVELLSKA
ncbi:sperm-associated antigen 8 isoform X4 [Vulpes lagopus]|uniref:sperm-associated antigen 8 isoform X4 n=1 Tax=Vulpes lagopus TaxID=494514 RepID=UPI001BCA0E95|nr:sperm-associated antigen 8 isoform X4 [Vulpes lagopus]